MARRGTDSVTPSTSQVYSRAHLPYRKPVHPGGLVPPRRGSLLRRSAVPAQPPTNPSSVSGELPSLPTVCAAAAPSKLAPLGAWCHF
eukprot:6889468-Pyramimonas_sp.AAC.3